MRTLPRWRARLQHRAPSILSAALLAPGSLLLVLLAPAMPLLAQDRDSPDMTVIGRVTDQSTQAPIPGVVVQVEGTQRRTLTDSAGIFMFQDLTAGPKVFVFTQFGYVDTRLDTTPRAGEALRVAMIPRPIELEAIAVHIDRLEERANAVAYSVRAFEQDDIMTSAASNPWQFIRHRYGLIDVQCPGPFLDRCIRWRGQAIRPIVYIDENRAYGGIDALKSYPMQDVYRIEVFRRGAMIRAYTNWFMEQLAQGNRRLRPVLMWRD